MRQETEGVSKAVRDRQVRDSKAPTSLVWSLAFVQTQKFSHTWRSSHICAPRAQLTKNSWSDESEENPE